MSTAAPHPAGTELTIVVQEETAHAYFDAGNKVVVNGHLGDQHGEGAHYYITDVKGRYTGYSIPAANVEFSRSVDEVKASGLLETLPLAPETEVVVTRVDGDATLYQVGDKLTVDSFWLHEGEKGATYELAGSTPEGHALYVEVRADAIERA